MEKELNGKEMEEIRGGATSDTTRNNSDSPRCKACGGIMTTVKSYYVCMNVQCSEFTNKKTKDEVNWR